MTAEQQLQEANTELSERLAALEFALESMDWRLLTSQTEQEFSREGLRTITDLARVMYLKNPIIQRGVKVQRLYVWGQGVSITAKQEEIQAVIGDFDSDPKNQVELTSHQARMNKETEQATDGNTFFVFFPNAQTGRVRVRTIDFNEIFDILSDPEDAKSPRFYLRQWSVVTYDSNGAIATEMKRAYYPDWRYNPTSKPQSINSAPVMWQSPIYHVKTGGFSGWKFGVSEIYAAIDWARAYKEFLEDWASIVRAYRKFAFQLTTTGGKAGIAAAKTKLSTTLGNAGSTETNPSPVVGSTFLAGENVNLSPIRTSGATVAAEDGRRILLMVAAASGLPETFYGDASVGSLATAQSLDRPTELMMKDRQSLWMDVLGAIYQYVVLWAVKAPKGALKGLGRIERIPEGDEVAERVVWNADINPHIDIEFPPILSGDTLQRVQAIISAATLDGKTTSSIDLPTVTRMLLIALGEDDVDEIINRLYPDGQVPEQPVDGNRPQSEALMVEAVRELRDSLVKLQ